MCTITTDGNGLATTKDSNADANGWAKPEGWSAALAYGTYFVHEVIPADVAAKFKAEYGKTLLPIDDFKVTISRSDSFPNALDPALSRFKFKYAKGDTTQAGNRPSRQAWL